MEKSGGTVRRRKERMGGTGRNQSQRPCWLAGDDLGQVAKGPTARRKAITVVTDDERKSPLGAGRVEKDVGTWTIS
jgi:hypothetical protein